MQEFGGVGYVFIIPDQASIAAYEAAGTSSTLFSPNNPGLGYNANNAQNPTTSLGTTPNNDIVPGFVPEPTWPCVGEKRDRARLHQPVSGSPSRSRRSPARPGPCATARK